MARFKTKVVYIDAVKYDGSNGATIQTLAGTHYVDYAGKYAVPNFDYATTWLPEVPEGIVGVIWNGTGWLNVAVGDWIVRDASGKLNVMKEADLVSGYDLA